MPIVKSFSHKGHAPVTRQREGSLTELRYLEADNVSAMRGTHWERIKKSSRFGAVRYLIPVDGAKTL